MGVFDYSADDLAAILNQQPIGFADGSSASVAVVFRRGREGTELLFIQRASKHTDPWSGHMAFPGGRTDPGDIDSYYTAERETLEEVGLDLTGTIRLGSLDTLVPDRHLHAVHAQAYWLDGPRPALRANYEVADILWVPLTVLCDENRFIDHYYVQSRSSWPGIQLDKPSQVVWGLTLRFLGDLCRRLELPMIALAPPA